MIYLLLIERKRKERKKWPGCFLSRAGHVLLAVPCEIFLVVRGN
jgi:hypothetical protein